MSEFRPPKGRPKTEKHLGQLVSQYAEASGLGVRRVRQRISAMAFVGALDRVREEDSPARFLIKGGIACELRFQSKARATRDLDAVFHGSLDELLAVGTDRGDHISLMDTLADRSGDPTMGLEGQETRGLLAAAINSLSEREKIVVTLYYFEGLTLAEIGDILSVAESRVCQIHTKAVGQLRLQLVETE